MSDEKELDLEATEAETEEEEAEDEDDEEKRELEDELTATVYADYTDYDLVIRADGTGTIGYHSFKHELTLAEIHKMQEDSPDEDELQDEIITYFWSYINDTLDSPMYQDGDEGVDLHWVKGSGKELEELARLFHRSESPEDLEKNEYTTVRVRSAWGEDDTPELDDDEYNFYGSDRFNALMNKALEQHVAVGYWWEYDDSSYSRTSHTVDLDLEDLSEITPRERMNAMIEVRKWLLEQGVAEEDLKSYGVVVDEKVL